MNNSDDEDVSDLVAALTEDDIRGFISEKKIRNTCAECGHDKVGLSTNRNGLTPSIMSMNAQTPGIYDTYVNFYFQLVCFNCGHLRMFERGEVAKWKVAKGKPDDSR